MRNNFLMKTLRKKGKKKNFILICLPLINPTLVFLEVVVVVVMAEMDLVAFAVESEGRRRTKRRTRSPIHWGIDAERP